MAISFGELQNKLLSQKIVDCETDRNNFGEICGLKLYLLGGTTIVVKTPTNQRIVFEEQNSRECT